MVSRKTNAQMGKGTMTTYTRGRERNEAEFLWGWQRSKSRMKLQQSGSRLCRMADGRAQMTPEWKAQQNFQFLSFLFFLFHSKEDIYFFLCLRTYNLEYKVTTYVKTQKNPQPWHVFLFSFDCIYWNMSWFIPCIVCINF